MLSLSCGMCLVLVYFNLNVLVVPGVWPTWCDISGISEVGKGVKIESSAPVVEEAPSPAIDDKKVIFY